MNINNSIGNGTFAEATLTVAGIEYYGLEDLLRRFDESKFSKHYGIVDKKTGEKVNPKEFIWAWIQKELQKEWDQTLTELGVEDDWLLEACQNKFAIK